MAPATLDHAAVRLDEFSCHGNHVLAQPAGENDRGFARDYGRLALVRAEGAEGGHPYLMWAESVPSRQLRRNFVG